MKPLAIVIPVKSPHQGKSRLGGVLRPADRYDLNLRLLAHTLDVAAELIDDAEVYVVSKSAEALAEARLRGFAICLEPDFFDLNAAVTLAVRQAQADGIEEIMVLPVDLPWLHAERLRALVAEFRTGSDVMIITDRVRNGTNLLLWRPIATVSVHYGPGSAARHADAATRLGLRTVVRDDPQLSFDIDTPQDFAEWSRGDGSMDESESSSRVAPPPPAPPH
jgi:2-phospho-L-lactate guanylyltransferase